MQQQSEKGMGDDECTTVLDVSERRCRSGNDFLCLPFQGGEILDVKRHDGDALHEATGKLAFARYCVGDQILICNDSTVRHAFNFTPSLSRFIECNDEAELNRLFAALGDGGKSVDAARQSRLQPQIRLG